MTEVRFLDSSLDDSCRFDPMTVGSEDVVVRASSPRGWSSIEEWFLANSIAFWAYSAYGDFRERPIPAPKMIRGSNA